MEKEIVMEETLNLEERFEVLSECITSLRIQNEKMASLIITNAESINNNTKTITLLSIAQLVQAIVFLAHLWMGK